MNYHIKNAHIAKATAYMCIKSYNSALRYSIYSMMLIVHIYFVQLDLVEITGYCLSD